MSYHSNIPQLNTRRIYEEYLKNNSCVEEIDISSSLIFFRVMRPTINHYQSCIQRLVTVVSTTMEESETATVDFNDFSSLLHAVQHIFYQNNKYKKITF